MVDKKQPQKKEQVLRFTDKELKLMKNVFAEKPEMLIAIRKVMLQIELTEQEDVLIKTVVKGDVPALIRKVFLPTIDGNAPLNQIVDLMMTIKIEDKTPEEAHPHIMARKQMIDYIDQQLSQFEIPSKVEEINLEYLSRVDGAAQDGKSKNGNYIDLTTRNTIIQHVEQMLFQVKVLAGTVEETEEEMHKRITQNSSK